MAEQQRVPEKKASGSLIFLGWLATALGVPSVAGLVLHRWVAKHVALSILLGILIAAALAVVGLAQELWRRRYKDQVLDWISAAIDRRMSPFWQRYREHLLADLRYVDLRGLAGRFFDPDLSDVYVDVALRPSDPEKAPSSDLPHADVADMSVVGQRQKISDLLGRPQPRVLVIIGTPGSGKTTLLRYTVLGMCRARHVRRQSRNTPILLYARDHYARIVKEPQVGLPALVADSLAPYGLTDHVGWLEKRLSTGDCVVMLDGLDEVAREEDRKAVAEWVRVQVIRYSGNDFVVTSRPLGYQGSQIYGALTVQTQPFTREQVTRFVRRWCLTEERWSTGSYNEVIIRRAEAEADDLLQRLQAAPNLWPLTVNPLLLTMIAIVHRHYGALPGSRAELYSRICQVLLWSRQDAKKLTVEPRGDQKERLMRVLAFEMMRRNVRDLSTAEASAIMRPVLRRISKDLTVKEVLYDAASNGLFIEREDGVRAFAHQTFQEYLAAAHIKDKNLQEILINAVSDIWWRETALLYVAGADAGPIVEACLAANTLSSLTLAFDCAEEAGELSPELRGTLTSLLAEGLADGAGPEQRRAASGVVLTRHLRQVAETASGARICSQPITWGIYRLFLQDMEARGQPRPLDAPAAHVATDADEIVRGMRGSDALAFVDWTNEITGGRSTYRLPSQQEMHDLPTRNALFGERDSLVHRFWVAADDAKDFVQLYPPSDTSAPGQLSGTRLSEQLETDFVGAPLALGILPLMVHVTVTARLLDDTRYRGLPEVITDARGLLQDLADAVEPGPAYELSQRIGNTLASLARHDLDAVRAMLRTVERTLELLLSADETEVTRDLIIVRQLASIVRRDLSLIRDYSRILYYEPMRASDPDAPDPDVDDASVSKRAQCDVELARNIELIRGVQAFRDADAGIARRIDFESVGYLSRIRAQLRDAVEVKNVERAHDVGHIIDPLLATVYSSVLGHGFSRMLAIAPDDESSSARADMTARSVIHAGRFAKAAGVGSADYTMSPDSLLDAVQKATIGLNARLRKGDRAPLEHARLVADRFASLVEGVLIREQRVEEPIGLSLRIMTLCLAAEAEALGTPDLAEDFRRIAAGITWLELRHGGAEPPMEAIVLAQS